MATDNMDNTIEKLRTKIDGLDRQIIKLLAERSAYVDQVGHIKKKASPGGIIIRPGREAAMVKKILSWPSGKMMKETVGAIWRMIIAGSIAIEQKISVSAFTDEACEIICQAREFYGAFTPVKKCRSLKVVIEDILGRKPVIGIFPASTSDIFEPWFTRAIENNPSLKIFSRLPFVESSRIKSIPSFLIGKVIPEPTGSDTSLFLIETPRNTKPDKVRGWLKKSGFKSYSIVSSANKVISSYFLVEIKGFISEKDMRVKKFSLIGARINHLGCYANPVILGKK